MDFKRVVGAKGQVVIPKDVRRHLGIRPGTEIVFQVEGKETIVKPSTPPVGLVHDYVLVLTKKLTHKVRLNEIIEEETLQEIGVRRQ